MKCPECIEEGKTSKVYPRGTSRTLMYSTPWYDEKGTYHNHDLNTTTEFFDCSEHHQWVESFKPQCPAGDYP